VADSSVNENETSGLNKAGNFWNI